MMRTFQICLFVSLVVTCTVGVCAQSQTDADRAVQQARNAIHSRDIPEASLPCTPEEAKWWEELRAATKNFNRAQPDRPESKKLMRLIKEGIDKSYQIPVPDRHPTIFWQDHPRATPKRINGSIALAVELLPDGTVGEVKIAQGLDPDLDKNAIETVRKLVFLPAIKNRKFVSLWMPMTMGYSTYETYHR